MDGAALVVVGQILCLLREVVIEICEKKGSKKCHPVVLGLDGWTPQLVRAGVVLTALSYVSAPSAQRLLVFQALLVMAFEYPPMFWLRFRQRLPFAMLVPWHLLLVAALWVLPNGPEAARMAVSVGKVDGYCLVWSVICAVASSLALWGWSVGCGGDHGPVQRFLGSFMSWVTIGPFAVVNAMFEELEHRSILYLASVATLLPLHAEAPWPSSWHVLAITTQALWFAMKHYRGGFPSGVTGFILVFLWSSFLGFLMSWSGGLALVLFDHIVADVVIGLLVLRSKRRPHKARGAQIS